ncbi:hypothetical protein H6F74_27415 [Trichocoleus sp. FACHB-90]|uniref:hypothetical protein n=1 Tax=Cyanophyceae TaxID=3028117 RepID=UPI00168868C8|nr:hypothetical protein [Trichocoleus sp. FACHB-90]MBD1929932.1 hypothetical protein [Trichocoleus sp. FACHB-90]
MEQYTLGRALKLWETSIDAQNVGINFDKYLSIGLRQYVFPELDPAAQSLKREEFASFCDQLPVAQLKGALDIFDQQFALAVEKERTSRSTGRNYRSTLKQFTHWLEKQAWWPCLFPDPVATVSPFREKSPALPKTRERLSRYGLSKENLPSHVLKELEEFKEFRLTGGRNIRRTVSEPKQYRESGEARRPKIDTIKPSTFKNNEDKILAFLGWYAQKYPNSELKLELLTDLDLLDKYTYWAIDTRGVCHCTGVHTAKTAIAIAKWLNYDKSTRRNWSDIGLILDLKDLRNEYAQEYAKERKQLDAEKWSRKKLTHPEAQQVVQYLRNLCAPYTTRRDKKTGEPSKYRTKRQTSAVARSWQTYLIVKILVYCPVRQEEIRNFALEETLFRRKDDQGTPYYEAYFEEHKRATQHSSQSKPRRYRLPAILTQDLDMWVCKWRPLIEELVSTPEGWMELWKYKLDKVEGIHQRIEAAQQGILPKTVKSSPEEYMQYLEWQLKGVERRINAWEIARSNLEANNRLFLVFGKHETEAFGKPVDKDTLWITVSRAFAIATQALFGEARWINPHALRHIAEKHIRQPGREDITEAFGTLIGHSKKMGDEYAEQITSEYELTEEITDDWWIEDI